jgi:hypothetical protein
MQVPFVRDQDARTAALRLRGSTETATAPESAERAVWEAKKETAPEGAARKKYSQSDYFSGS